MEKMMGVRIEKNLLDLIKKVGKLKKSSLKNYVLNALMIQLKSDGIDIEKIIGINNKIMEINNAL